MLDALVPPRTELLKLYAETRENPKLIHFCGHVKPWHAESKHPYTNVYLKYNKKLREPVRT